MVSIYATIIQNSSGSPSYRNQRRKRKSKALTADDMTLYVESHKDSIRKLLELISEFSKVAE